ncbi:MAG: ABC transporter permease [Eubacterium sp.]|nr:ABC transporter permease [Eubacterium sp.]
MNQKYQKPSRFFTVLSRFLAHEKWSFITVPIFSIILAIIVSSIILLVLGKNPFTALYSFLAGNGFLPKESYGGNAGMLSDFFQFLNVMAPMLLAALAFIFAYRCRIFNIGIAGQMLLSGFMATVLIGYSKLGAGLAKPLVVVVGIITGGLVGALIGFLKYRFNIHEVVSTIMINYIISYATGFLINAKYVDVVSRAAKICSPESRLTLMKIPIAGQNCNIPIGILIAIAAAILVSFIFRRTVFGFELHAVGSNANCARYSGINVGKQVVSSMMISGMLAGLAGVVYYLGYTNQIIPKTLAGMGYDSIATGLLGNSNPIGVIFSSVLITIFQNGNTYMSSVLGIDKEIASVIIGILLLFSACGGFFRMKAERYLDILKSIEARRNDAAMKESAQNEPVQEAAAAEETAEENSPEEKTVSTESSTKEGGDKE